MWSKQVFLVENYPKKCDILPDHLLEVQHRARDIMFSDKTLHSIQMSKTITYYFRFIDELYHLIESELASEKREKNREKLEKIRMKYKKISEQHDAEIKGVYYISRDEQFPSLRENADFSIDTVKASIKQAELKTNHILKNITLS